jgi:hypothetical protein
MTVKTAPISKKAEPNSKTKPPKTKKARLIAWLSTKKGASIETLCTEFGWQPHTVHAALSGLRSAGHAVVRTSGKNGSIYRIMRDVET